MVAKELKEILIGVPDNAKIVLSNPQWKRSEIVGYQFVENSIADNNAPVLFIDAKNFR